MQYWYSVAEQPVDLANTGGVRGSPASGAVVAAVIRDHRLIHGLLSLIVAASLCVDVIPGPAHSQGVQLVNVNVSVIGKGYRLSKLLGASVQNDKNEAIGKIDDVIVDNSKALFAVLQVGGFLGLGSRLVAVPYGALKISEDGKRIELPGASKEALKNFAEFKYVR